MVLVAMAVVSRSTVGDIFTSLPIVGGLAWGGIGVERLVEQAMDVSLNWNIVNQLLGWAPTLEAVTYVLVGASSLVAAIYILDSYMDDDDY